MNRWLSPLCLLVFFTLAAAAQSRLVTSNGWPYEVLTAGNGQQLTPEYAALIHNQLIDSEGHIHVSTYRFGVPDYQLLSELSEPFKSAFAVMRAGGKYRFHIPVEEFRAAMRSASQLNLPPGEVIWEMEILQILPPLPDVASVVVQVYKSQGAEAAFRKFEDLRSQRNAEVYFGEWEINQLGYLFLQQGQLEKAIEIFRYNTEAHPDSFNANDSLGEAYLRIGNKDLAEHYYRRSLQINPNNENARQMLAQLEN